MSNHLTLFKPAVTSLEHPSSHNHLALYLFHQSSLSACFVTRLPITPCTHRALSLFLRQFFVFDIAMLPSLFRPPPGKIRIPRLNRPGMSNLSNLLVAPAAMVASVGAVVFIGNIAYKWNDLRAEWASPVKKPRPLLGIFDY